MNSSDVMQRVSFYEAICEANINAENWLLTVVDGDHAGEKAMISSGEFVWRSDDGGFVTEHEERLKKEVLSGEGRGLIETGGIRVYAELLGNRKEVVICGSYQ